MSITEIDDYTLDFYEDEELDDLELYLDNDFYDDYDVDFEENNIKQHYQTLAKRLLP